jgi:serine/threonine-protein kinase TNNI3K
MCCECPGEGPHLSVGAIVGITLAGVAFVLGIAGLLYWMYRRRRRRQRQKRESSAIFAGEKRSKRQQSRYDLDTPTTGSASTGNFASMHGAFIGTNSNNSSQMSTLRAQGGMWDDDAITTVRIPFEKVERTSLLNRGGYGEVYRGTYHGETVAIKMLLPATRRDIRQINAFLAEVKMMAAMEHERIVRFIGVAWDSLSDLCAVSEYMEGGDLRTLLTQFEARERRPKGFDRDKARIALHVMHALTYLHSLDPVVLHRDLKSKNILLTADLDAKITDFGVSRESSDKTMTAGVGTSLWMAPEVMMGERYDEKADMFSFGVVLSELDSHLLPYAMAKETDSGRVLPDTALLQMVSLGRLRIEMSSNAPQAVAELAYACVALNPRNRPSAPEALYCLDRIFKYDWNR